MHAGVFGAWFDPLAAALEPCRVIGMRRAGYTRPGAPQRPRSIADHANHAAEVIRAVGTDGFERARAEAGFFITDEILAVGAWPFDDELGPPARR